MKKLLFLTFTFLILAVPVLGEAKVTMKWKQSHFGFMHPERAYDEMQELNVHWSRPHPGEFIWGNIEDEDGNYDWSDVDKYVKKAQKNKVNIVATIWPYADWDQAVCRKKLKKQNRQMFEQLGDYRSKPCDMDRYQKWVRKAVERYDGDGKKDMKGLKYPIKYWEVINEPSMKGSLTFFKGSAKSYRVVLKQTSKAIKRRYPKARVLNGGAAGVSDDVFSYWRKVLRKKAKRKINIWNFHNIGGEDKLGIPEMNDFMTEKNINKNLWMTELEFEAAAAGMEGATSEEWAAYIIEQYVYAFSQDIKKIFYVGLDNSPGDEETWLIDKNGNKQYMFYAFQTMVDKIDYFTEVDQLKANQYKFKVDDQWVYVLWGNGNPSNEISGIVDVTDLAGTITQMDISELDLTDSPVFVEMVQ